jgi:hypothetical protein
MNTPNAADGPIASDAFANSGSELAAAFGAVTPAAAPFAAIDTGLADA